MMMPFEGIMFNIVPVMIFIIFIIVFGTIIVRAIQGIGEWGKNNQSPQLTVSAKVIAKRTDVHYHNQNMNQNIASSSSTTYYVTFEVASGDRMEFKMQGSQYGMLIEGDQGELTFQGTRYLGFERHSVVK